VAACDLAGSRVLESPRFALAYRTEPPRPGAGEHFAVELRICRPAAGAEGLRVDAHMPEHRHGMNYRPGLVALGGGHYRSEGWLFHMPGEWEFVFELGGERLADGVRIE